MEHLDSLRPGARQGLGESGEAGQVGEDHRAIDHPPRDGRRIGDPACRETARVVRNRHFGRMLEPPVPGSPSHASYIVTVNVPESSTRAQ